MKKSTNVIRISILAAVLLLTTIQGRLHAILKLFPPVDAFCPFGGLEAVYGLIKYDAMIRKIALSSFILLGAVLITALFFRRSFCGNICPLGFLQEISAKIGRKFFVKRKPIPSVIDRKLRYLKYVILAVVIAGTWYTMNLIFRPWDPWAAYHHIGSDELFAEYLFGVIILALSVVVSFFDDRFFCKYLCPMGAFLAPVSRIGIFKIRNDREKCISCGCCDHICQMNIPIADKTVITSAECISCMECVEICPVDSLSVEAPSAGEKKRNLKPSLLIILTASVFVIVIAVTTLTGSYVWKAPTGLPHKTERLLLGPAQIKDNNNFIDIIQIYRISPDYIISEWNIGEEELSEPFEDLGIDPKFVRDFVEKIYSEAGLDPKNLLGGGGRGQH